MREYNTIYWNRKTFNTAYIFLIDYKKVKETTRLLEQLNMGYTIYLDKHSDVKVYAIKMFRIKRDFLKLVAGLKEVLSE